MLSSHLCGRRAWVGWLLLFLALAAIYGPTLDHPFHYDDLHSVVENPHVRGLDNAVGLFEPRAFSVDPERGMFRPLVVLSYRLNYEFGGLNPRGYHLVNVLLHLACAGVVGWLATTSGLARRALPAAALFAVHPLAVEVASYVSSRSESLATLGLLVAFGAYIYGRREEKTRPLAGAALAMFAGLLAKATAITSIAMLALWELRTRRHFLLMLPFALIILAYLLQTRQALGTAVGQPVRSLSSQLMTQTKAIVYYCHLLFVPTDLSVEHAFSEAHRVDPTVVLAALVLGSVCVAIWRLASSLHKVVFACALVTLAPSTLIPLNVLVNDHRLYPVLALLVPLFSGSFGLASIASGAQRQKWWGSTFLVGLLVMGTLSAQRVDVWSSGLTLWQDAVDKAPGAYRAHLHLGEQQEQTGIELALPSYERAVELAPNNEQTHYNLGRALHARGDTMAAVEAFARSLELAPAFAQAAINLAVLQDSSGSPQVALDVLTRTIAHRAQDPELYRRRALVQRGLFQDKAAEADFRLALAKDPGHVETHFSLANLLYDGGRVQEAVQHYQVVIRSNPAHQGAIYNLADLAIRQGNPAFAQQVGEAALLVGPVQGKLYYLLALAYEQKGMPQQAVRNFQRFLQAWPVAPAVGEAVRQRIKQLNGG
ncbi:MAG: tetratricopeptide repeat protein [Gemmatimonadetes bacterium]|nr:tetratricopeptide repeat protein [Gemmatimonadota bacterium]